MLTSRMQAKMHAHLKDANENECAPKECKRKAKNACALRWRKQACLLTKMTLTDIPGPGLVTCYRRHAHMHPHPPTRGRGDSGRLLPHPGGAYPTPTPTVAQTLHPHPRWHIPYTHTHGGTCPTPTPTVAHALKTSRGA